MAYYRVIPRDLFNEAKLLKCLGQLSLLIHEGKGIRWPLSLDHESPEEGFIIDQDESSGELLCANLSLSVGRKPIGLRSPYNSKRPYPLRFVGSDEDEGEVFDDDGSLSAEFTDWLDR